MVRLHSRNDAVKYIKDKYGIEFSPNTFAKYFCLGGGPKCRHVGRRPYYSEVDLDEWIEARLTRARANSSEPRVFANASAPDEPHVSGKSPPDEPRVTAKAKRRIAAQAQPDAV
jgi:hypothetical protein